MFDTTSDGRPLKVLTLVDEFTRECLALKVERRHNSARVIEALAEVMLQRGAPAHIRSDNGPEFIAQRLRRWLAQRAVQPLYSEPGAPWENAYNESFNSRLRDELLAGEVFDHLLEAKALAARWREDYNRRRPHSALGYRTPAEFAAHWAEAACATLRPPQPSGEAARLTHIAGGS